MVSLVLARYLGRGSAPEVSFALTKLSRAGLLRLIRRMVEKLLENDWWLLVDVLLWKIECKPTIQLRNVRPTPA